MVMILDNAETHVVEEISSVILTEMLNTVSDMVFVCVDGNIRHVNNTVISTLGATGPEDLLGIRFLSLICDDFAASSDDLLGMLCAEKSVTPMHINGLNGIEHSISVKVNRLQDLGDAAYVLTAQNISNQVKLSQDIRDSEARFGKLIDNALDFICVMKDGILTYVNQAGMKLLNVAHKEEVIGQHIDTFMHPNYQGILGEDLHEFITDGELLPMRFIDINQNPIDVELGIVILEHGTHPRYMIEARDITAHNRAVTALRSSIENLEHRVEERTRALSAEVVERRRAEEKMRHIASHDGLTGLPNRSLLLDRLEQATKRTHRDAKKYAILFIDLDGFKPINDTLGHDIGDGVLKNVAARLQESVRETDTAARFGGDEFVVLLTDLDSKDAAGLIAKKIITRLAEPMELDSVEAKVGASIGIAFYPDDAETSEGVLKKADDAMYVVKGSGKNSYIMASENTE